MLFVVLSTLAFAQSNYQDVVYLKNGSVIRGIIVEQVPNQSIKIETADKSIFVYKMEEIEKLAKEGRQSRALISEVKPGYQGIVEVGYGIKTGDYGLNVLKFNIINGYRINNNFAVGLGTGIRHYTEGGESATLIPIFADLRANITSKNIAPYVAFGIGYSFNASDSFSGIGLLINPTAGVGFKMKTRSILHVGLGYEMQRTKATYSDYYNNYYYESSETTGAISLNVGISF